MFISQFISKDLSPEDCKDYNFGYNDCPKCIQARVYVPNVKCVYLMKLNEYLTK